MAQSKQDRSTRPYPDAPWSANLLRIIGYCLLILSLFDLMAILVPPQFMNPLWELQTVGNLVERVVLPLLGLGLVFYGEEGDRSGWEFPVLRFLSWSCLLYGILYLLLIPLEINDTLRLSTLTDIQTIAQYDQQQERIEQAEQKIDSAKPEQIDNYLKSQGRSNDGKNPQEVKKQLLAGVFSSKQKLQAQYKAASTNQQITLMKNSAKWNLGSLVSGALFIYIWRLTKWTRS